MTKGALINGVIVGVAIAAGLAVSIRPWQVYQDQRKLADDQITQMHKSEQKFEQLVRDEARMRSNIGKEEMARDRGYLPQGEVPAPK
jgi:hypothetical protein